MSVSNGRIPPLLTRHCSMSGVNRISDKTIYSSRKPPQRSHQLSFSMTDQLTLYYRTNLIMENKLASSRLIGLQEVCVFPFFIPFYLTSVLKFVSNRCLKLISFRPGSHLCQIFLQSGNDPVPMVYGSQLNPLLGKLVCVLFQYLFLLPYCHMETSAFFSNIIILTLAVKYHGQHAKKLRFFPVSGYSDAKSNILKPQTTSSPNYKTSSTDISSLVGPNSQLKKKLGCLNTPVHFLYFCIIFRR